MSQKDEYVYLISVEFLLLKYSNLGEAIEGLSRHWVLAKWDTRQVLQKVTDKFFNDKLSGYCSESDKGALIRLREFINASI